MDPATQDRNIVLRLKLDKFSRSNDDVDEVVLSRFNNTLNELVSGKIVSSYRLQQPIRVAQQLTIFYSYEPKYKHYLFLNNTTVVILRKVKGQLVLHSSYEDVVSFVIEDHQNIGKPQVVIHVRGSDQPLVTDCHNDNKPLKSGSKQVQAFASLLLKTNSKKRNAEILLAEKAKLLTKLSMTLAFNCDDGEILPTRDRLVYLREGLANSHVGLLTKGKALTVGEPWLRVHSKCWVLGFPVVNVSSDDLSCFQLYVCHECATTRRTLLFANPSNADLDQREDVLAKGQVGTVVAVVDQLQLAASVVHLKCVANFQNSRSHERNQCYLGQLTVKISDLFSSTHRVSTQKLSPQDLTTIQACSKTFELPFKLVSINRTEFLSALSNICNFKRIKKQILASEQLPHSFPCYLLLVDRTVDKLRVFTESHYDFSLLVLKLIDSFEGSVRFENPHSDPLSAWNALKSELSRIRDVLQEPISSELETVSRELMLLESRSADQMCLLRMHPTYM